MPCCKLCNCDALEDIFLFIIIIINCSITEAVSLPFFLPIMSTSKHNNDIDTWFNCWMNDDMLKNESEK